LSDAVAGRNPDRHIDVLILGAGPAGSALALALRRAGIGEVLLIDRPSRKPLRMGESAAPGLGSLLRRLGLDDRLEARGHRPCYGNRSLWGRAEPVVEDFMTRAQGPGWHLDRAAFDSWLQGEVVAAGAELLSPAHFVSADHESDAWQVAIRTGEATLRMHARWIVDSTGRPAAFARRSGARLRRLDRLIGLAVLATPADGRGFDGYSLVESTGSGWWYGARLPDGRAVVALMTDSDIAQSTGLFSSENFRQAWAGSSEISRFAAPPAEGARPVAYAAGTQFIDRAIAPGWLALGDALMAFDPLCAAGITGALEDAIAAAGTIVGLLDEPSEEAARELRRAYAARADAGLRRYMAEHRAVYAAERRWPESNFWQRRGVFGQAQTARPTSMPS
jgi:flavin-dependent dehydrogenase